MCNSSRHSQQVFLALFTIAITTIAPLHARLSGIYGSGEYNPYHDTTTAKIDALVAQATDTTADPSVQLTALQKVTLTFSSVPNRAYVDSLGKTMVNDPAVDDINLVAEYGWAIEDLSSARTFEYYLAQLSRFDVNSDQASYVMTALRDAAVDWRKSSQKFYFDRSKVIDTMFAYLDVNKVTDGTNRYDALDALSYLINSNDSAYIAKLKSFAATDTYNAVDYAYVLNSCIPTNTPSEVTRQELPALDSYDAASVATVHVALLLAVENDSAKLDSVMYDTTTRNHAIMSLLAKHNKANLFTTAQDTAAMLKLKSLWPNLTVTTTLTANDLVNTSDPEKTAQYVYATLYAQYQGTTAIKVDPVTGLLPRLQGGFNGIGKKTIDLRAPLGITGAVLRVFDVSGRKVGKDVPVAPNDTKIDVYLPSKNQYFYKIFGKNGEIRTH